VVFSIIIVLLLWPVRKIGWMLSSFLYHANSVLCIMLLTVWGGGVGFLVGILDWKFRPHIVFKIIFGFFGGLYLSCPNFGMLNEATIPWDAQWRHKLIAHYPKLLFAVTVLAMFYLNHAYLSVSPTVSSNDYPKLTTSEIDTTSKIFSKAMVEELTESDFAALKRVLKEYNDRTGMKIKKTDVEVLTKTLEITNEYYYELGQSLLNSWDNKSKFTTHNYDEVLTLVKKYEIRKPEKIKMDLRCLEAAASNQDYVHDEEGNKFEFGREVILQKLRENEISRNNFERIKKFLDENIGQ
jgi:hypothetical protein